MRSKPMKLIWVYHKVQFWVPSYFEFTAMSVIEEIFPKKSMKNYAVSR